MNFVFLVFRQEVEEGIYHEVLERVFASSEDADEYIKLKTRPDEYHREGWNID